MELFDSKSYTRVQSTLNHIRDAFDCQVYIEDIEGRLLYTCDGAAPDAWRSQFVPFSAPSHPDAMKLLAKWRSSVHIDRLHKVVLAPDEMRVLLPLSYQGTTFATVHYVARSGSGLLDHFLDTEFAKALSDKVYIVVMGSINITRKRYLPTESVSGLSEVLHERNEHRERSYQVAYLDFGDIGHDQFSTSVVDYASVAMRHTKEIAKHLLSQYTDGSTLPRFYLFHRREDHLQTVIILVHDATARPEPYEAVSDSNATVALTVPMGLGPLFASIDELGDRIEEARRILDSGRQLHDGKHIFSQADIGFDAFVWQLFGTQYARTQADAALKPLEQHPELMRTLETYLANDGNVTKTAGLLVVDRRTVTYRLERIGTLLGRSIITLEMRVLLFLALKARKQL